MAICPLLKQECITEKCAWWCEPESEDEDNCVIALLPISSDLGDLKSDLNDVKNELDEIKGELDQIILNTSA